MKDNQLQTVSLEQAKRLKKIGFDWECDDAFFDNENIKKCYTCRLMQPCDICISAPTVALALKWFREVKGIYNTIEFNLAGFGIWYTGLFLRKEDYVPQIATLKEKYEAAESALLNELLTIIENQNE